MVAIDAIFNSLKTILIERFAISETQIRMEADLHDALNLDSMDAIDLLMAVNETFRVHVPQQALEKIHTVADLVSAIKIALHA